MCGIFGYVGNKNGLSVVLNGLKKLEYRGYDSAGVAGIKDNEIISFKTVGKLNVLEEEVKGTGVLLNTAIGHTRWATHGTPTVANAHPQFDEKKSLALVHNGIIENHDALRKSLEKKGVTFISDTDTETMAHLISSFYEGDIFKALQKAISHIEGAYAIALIHKDYPNQIIAIANHSPLVIGIGANETFISSDSQAFVPFTKEAMYLSDNEVAIVHPNKIEVFSSSWEEIKKNSTKLKFDAQEVSKGNYEHYTLKEIFQQPQTLRNAMSGRFLEEYGTAIFEEARLDKEELQAVERVLIIGCGTSLHAGLIGAYMMEEKARLPVRVEIASEFRYKNPVIPHGTFVIAISQSGETADTLACIREVQAKGAKVLSICNVESSTIARESSSCIFLHAGPEIGVCSTKAFTSQVVVLTLLSLLLARMRHMSKTEDSKF
jgi:glucosamine--fructose-6-phosphate aminotransferase (isomerizing)